MITRINIQNFKSIKTLSLSTTSLNLFMGLNGMGKSTIIQSLLLLRQSMKSGLKRLSLNGHLAEIGRGRDALYNFAETESIKFNLNFIQSNEKEYSAKLDYAYSAESDVLNLIDGHIDSETFSLPLFTNNFVFLNAERLSPSTTYKMSYDEVTNNHTIGIHGELAAHFLSMYGDQIIVPKSMCLETAASNKLLDQAQEWMKLISPGINITTEEISRIDKVVLSYGFQTNTISTNKFRPTNVGFGISYILPVIVACLSGIHKLIVIENPEAHLHPKGQAKMGELIAKCAITGAQLFIETHSDHIVNGLRVAVKEGIIAPKQVCINYFTKKVKDGESFTINTPIKIGSNGELSEYPRDFIDEWENQLMKLI